MYNKTLVILLSGKAGMGKTLAAKILKDCFISKNLNVINSSFATGVKEIAYKYIGWDGIKDEKGRKLLQILGTDVGRKYNPDCWVEYLLRTLENTSNFPYDVVIIDDWRFPNEFEYFKDEPLYNVVKVKILSREIKTYLNHDCGNHISENSLPEDKSYYNYTVFNDFIESNFLEKLAGLCDKLDSLQSKF